MRDESLRRGGERKTELVGHFLYFARWAVFLVIPACDVPPSSRPPSEAVASTEARPLDDLREPLDRTLETTYQRRLNLQEHAAWQVLHGVLAYQHEFRVERQPGGAWIPALEYLLEGGDLEGWLLEAGTVLDPQTGRRGLRAILEPGSKTGQGHADQWLAILSQCGLPPDQSIQVDGDQFTIGDLVAQVQWDVPRNVEREFSWTLIGLTAYVPTQATWSGQDGQPWSASRLVEAELEQDLATSACGGTHRLIGLSIALNRHLDQGGALEGVWVEAERRIQQGIADARQYQNADGAFSTHYFQRPGYSADLAQNLGSTGHVLEFLTLSLTDEQLDEPWVRRAVMQLCELFQLTRDLPLECGALYHAAHGLVLYRERMFGPRSYDTLSMGDRS